MINSLLSRSAELETRLLKFFELTPFNDSDRLKASRIMCSIAFEHAESAKILIGAGNLTSATGLVRLQYEALVRGMWFLYAATDEAVTKLMAELTHESANKANNIPMLAEMLDKLNGKAPQVALDMLIEFKEYSWKPLSSFVHGGIHAINRHSKGYPLPLLAQLLLISNGVSTMVGMLLIILHGGNGQEAKIQEIDKQFADCLPEKKFDVTT